MSLYVDKLTHRPVPRNRNYNAGKYAFYWCHLWGDSEQELRDYVAKVNMSGAKFQKPDQFCNRVHLQVLSVTRANAVENGAIDTAPKKVCAPVGGKEIRARKSAVPTVLEDGRTSKQMALFGETK